jgi:hypothetical protein
MRSNTGSPGPRRRRSRSVGEWAEKLRNPPRTLTRNQAPQPRRVINPKAVPDSWSGGTGPSIRPHGVYDAYGLL